MKILAVASTGGHWVQLKRLSPAFEGHELIFVSTDVTHKNEVGGRFYAVNDASESDKLSLLLLFVRMVFLMLRVRPSLVISTGAAPGLLALLVGRIFGANTLWVDSIANAEQMSKSGRMAKRFASKCVSQWQHVAKDEGVEYWGGVL